MSKWIWFFATPKKSAKIAENAQIPNFGSISTHRKYFFLQKKIFPQFLYIKNHWKNTRTFDFENFCNFQPYLQTKVGLVWHHWTSLCNPCERRCSESLCVLNIACAAGASWVVTARQAESSRRRSRINFVRAKTVLCWTSILISECRIAQSQGKSNDLWKD